ncbi:MAG TPA: GtrA family protein [Streptosporangiaceae bacterium]|jgi:putative flippase GtrA
MNTDSRGPGLLRRVADRVLRRRIARILTKYTLGSGLAFIASETVLLSLLGASLTGPKTASVAAWAAGALVNYYFSRNWAWGLRGRANPWREVLPFWATSVAALFVSTWTSDLAHGYAPELTRSHPLQVAFVGAVYLGTYGVLFVGKFLLFHYVIFGRRPATGNAAPR